MSFIDFIPKNIIWVSSSVTDGDGTVNRPFSKLQTAINNSTPETKINVISGSYQESLLISISDLIIEFIGESKLSGKLVLRNSKNVKISGGSIVSDGQAPLTFDNSESLSFTNCYLKNNKAEICITSLGTLSGEVSFSKCFIDGEVKVNSSNSFSFTDSYGFSLLQDSKNSEVSINNALYLKFVKHISGNLSLQNVGSIKVNSSGFSLESIASKGSYLSLVNVSLLQDGEFYGDYKKTGDCSYYFSNFRRGIDKELSGERDNLDLFSTDLKVTNSPLNYYPTDHSLEGHLQGIDFKFNSYQEKSDLLQDLHNKSLKGFLFKDNEALVTGELEGEEGRLEIEKVGSSLKFTLGSEVVTKDSEQVLKNKTITGSFIGNLKGNSESASKLKSTRKFNFLGGVKGDCFFDGSSDLDVKLEVLPNSHAHNQYYDKDEVDSIFVQKSFLYNPVEFNSEVSFNSYAKFKCINEGVWEGTRISPKFGGTGSDNGSIFGTGELKLSAGGLNKDIILNPAGEGVVRVDSSIIPLRSDSSLGSPQNSFKKVFATEITGSLKGNSSSASKLNKATNISFSGGINGSGSFDGSKNLDIECTVVNDSHKHNKSYYPREEADSRFFIMRSDELQEITGDVHFNAEVKMESLKLGEIEIKTRNNLISFNNAIINGSKLFLSEKESSPLVISSSTLVKNLNSEFLQDKDLSFILDSNNSTYINPTFPNLKTVSSVLDYVLTTGGSGGLSLDGSFKLESNIDLGYFFLSSRGLKANDGKDLELLSSLGSGLKISSEKSSFDTAVESTKFISTVENSEPPLEVNSKVLVKNLFVEKSSTLDKKVSFEGDLRGEVNLRSKGDCSVNLSSTLHPTQEYLIVTSDLYLKLKNTPVNPECVKITDIDGLLQLNASVITDTKNFSANFKVVGDTIYLRNSATSGVTEISRKDEIPEGTRLLVEYTYKD